MQERVLRRSGRRIDVDHDAGVPAGTVRERDTVHSLPLSDQSGEHPNVDIETRTAGRRRRTRTRRQVEQAQRRRVGGVHVTVVVDHHERVANRVENPGVQGLVLHVSPFLTG
jgi:hypothetical protein